MPLRKAGRDRSGHVDPFYERRRRYEQFLRSLDLYEPFARLPRGAQELFWKRKLPDPVLSFDSSFPDRDKADRALRNEVLRAFQSAEFEINGVKVLVRDFVSILTSFRLIVEGTKELRLFPDYMREFFQFVRTRIIPLQGEHFPHAFAAQVHKVKAPLIANSRFDTRMLYVTFDTGIAANGKVLMRATAHREQPQVVRLQLDGQHRPVYRVATHWNSLPLQWLSWTSDQLPSIPPGLELPVYVQSHALRQLQTRLDHRRAGPYLHCWLGESLSEPNIVRRVSGGDLLVEYRLCEHRFGYLVVSQLKGAIVVRTFLFLTMQQTPEARKLERKLRLTQRDIDWLRLSELSAFTETDLRHDAQLREIFAACGCGHLFELDEEDYAQVPTPHAAEVRRYLGLAA